MIEQLIVLGIAAIVLTAGTLITIHLTSVTKRKLKRQKLDELHHRKMQILDELKGELEVEALQKQKPDNILEVYDLQEVPT
ncbi:MAG: hypothetical protein WCV90_06985 [Candidatus Woesearchaeota archaeon]|jgi:hypothetical protein